MSAGRQQEVTDGMKGELRSHEDIRELYFSQRKVSNVVKAICRGRNTVEDLRQSRSELESGLNTSLPRQSILFGEWTMVSCWLLGVNLWLLHTELKDRGF